MKTIKKAFLVIVLISPVYFFGNEELKRGISFTPPYMEYRESTFGLNFFQGFGFRNVSWDLDVCYQFRQYFSVGIGSGFHLNTYPIFSSSDKHRLNMWSCPLYLKGTVYLFGNSDRACYIYGKYGRSFGIHTKYVDPNGDFKAMTVEGGVAYERIFNNASVYFELGQYYVSANGVLKSSYSSVINYNLQIYSIVGRVGFRITLS